MKLAAASVCTPRACVLKCFLHPGLSVQVAGRCGFEFPPCSPCLLFFGAGESTGGLKLGSRMLPGFSAGIGGPIPANKILSPVLFRRAVGAQYLQGEPEFEAVCEQVCTGTGSANQWASACKTVMGSIPSKKQ